MLLHINTTHTKNHTVTIEQSPRQLQGQWYYSTTCPQAASDMKASCATQKLKMAKTPVFMPIAPKAWGYQGLIPHQALYIKNGRCSIRNKFFSRLRTMYSSICKNLFQIKRMSLFKLPGEMYKYETVMQGMLVTSHTYYLEQVY